ncbi:DUF1173 family protein [Nocardia sp. ET3-3]|uniref:DUF1173 family protein n=1 Tax=Nocardia terrae TaxID=2675851 RepID=A0A7K1V2V5_9NOCA|nr:DUF1173 family protein [Nocardia terrae]MVU80832.1 DUF1173 family protein [Nocardia terrae]
MYAIDDQLIDRFHICDDYLQPLLAAVHRSPGRRPRCLCSATETGGVDMYVARIGGRYVLKRMPGTGPHHAPACPSFTPPVELTGLAPLIGTAIREQPGTGLTRLTLGFPLTRHPARASTATTGQCDAAAENECDNAKLSLRGLLHLLWDEAEFVRWVPAMAGRRRWPAIRRYVLLAADAKATKSRTLAELLWLPEPFTVAEKIDIAARRATMFAPYAASGRHKRLLLGLGEVKDIGAARFGRHKLIVKHAPDCPFILNPETLAILHRNFATELGLRQALPDTKLIALFTFGITDAGVAVADRVALMNVTADWIPFESVFEHTLVTGLVARSRRFRKAMRYNQPATHALAALILTDTDPPTACYLISAATNGAPAPNDPNLPLAQWIWNTSIQAMPQIPAPITAVSAAGPRRVSTTNPAAEEAYDPTFAKEAQSWTKHTTAQMNSPKADCAKTSDTSSR